MHLKVFGEQLANSLVGGPVYRWCLNLHLVGTVGKGACNAVPLAFGVNLDVYFPARRPLGQNLPHS